MKKIYLSILTLLLISYSSVNAQQTQDLLKQNIVFNIDNLGDGHIEESMTFNASQWDNFKKIMGSNEDMLKRQMERSLPAYFLQNFVYKEDAMNRTYTLTFDALGMAKINDNGEWQLDMDSKNPDITKISDNNYVLTATYATVQQMVKVNIPQGASEIQQTKDAFGKAIFTYTLTPGHKKISFIFLALGILFLAAGVVVYFKPDLFKASMQKKPVKYPFAPAPAAAPVQPVVPEQGQNPAQANSSSQS